MSLLLAEVIKLVSNKADTFSFVWRDHLDYDENAKKFEEILKPFFISEKRVKRWPGTELDSVAATIRFYRFEKASIEILKRNKFSYEYLSPSYPEDLAIYRGEQVIFSSCAHEHLEWLNN